MSTAAEENATPDFEIDHPELFGQFLVSNPREIAFYLDILAKRRSLLTAYINEGQEFFLTSIVGLDEANDVLLLDPSNIDGHGANALESRPITLVTNLDRVKIQIRLDGLKAGSDQEKNTLGARLPRSILRLQRRDFFRLEPPLSTPIHCQLISRKTEGSGKVFEFPLSDISGGGVSLIGPKEEAEHFPRDALFQDCRLEFPGDGVIQATLRVRKVIEIATRDGEHSLRIGCEFVNLPGTRLAFIERYIARIERERKAHHTGKGLDD